MKRQNYGMEEMVSKATSWKGGKITPPKRKHVRGIIIATWKYCDGARFLHELCRRPIDTNDVVCWKSLVTLHSVLFEGHPSVLSDSFFRTSYFERIKKIYQTTRLPTKGFPPFIIPYVSFLLDKIHFHQNHNEFAGDFSLEKFLKKKKNLSSEKMLEVVTHLMDLQQSMLDLQKILFSTNNSNDCMFSCLIPVVLESYNIYVLITHLLKKLVESFETLDLLTYLIERFYSQYITLRAFYSEVSSIQSVASVVAVPTLPKEPPSFKKPEKKKAAPKSPKKPLKAPTPEKNIQTSPIQPSKVVNPFTNPFSVIHRASSWEKFNVDPFHTNSQPLSTPASSSSSPSQHPPQSTTTPSLDSKDPSKTEEKPKPSDAPFSDLMGWVSGIKTPEIERKKKQQEQQKKLKEEQIEKERQAAIKRAQEARKKKQEEERKLREEQQRKEEEEKKKKQEEERERKRKEEEKRKEQEELQRKQQLEQEKKKMEEEIKNIVKQETNEEIKNLKVKILELENKLRSKTLESEKETSALQSQIKRLQEELKEERTNNQTLENELRDLKNSLASDSQEMEQLRAEIQEKEEQNTHLISKYNAQIESIQYALQEQQNENERLMGKELEIAMNTIESFLHKLDNPTNLGNPSARIIDVTEDIEILSKNLHQLKGSSLEGSNEMFIEHMKDTIFSCGQLFDNTKGASRAVEQEDRRLKFLDAARDCGNALIQFFNSLACDERLDETLEQCNVKLEHLKLAAIETEKIETEQPSQLDLEALAEKELMNAVQIIEAAAQSLNETKKKQEETPSKIPQVAQSLLAAVMAITESTALLVKAATKAQQERKQKGLQDPTSFYKPDSAWTQGLISAAKEVAQSTSILVQTANDAVEGKISEEGVIAASKSVAAGTAQLVAACRAKSDPNSLSQQNLNSAAKRVVDATQTLVQASKAATEAETKTPEQQEGVQISDFAYKKKEMELIAETLRLEKERERIQTQLRNLRKGRYNAE